MKVKVKYKLEYCEDVYSNHDVIFMHLKFPKKFFSESYTFIRLADSHFTTSSGVTVYTYEEAKDILSIKDNITNFIINKTKSFYASKKQADRSDSSKAELVKLLSQYKGTLEVDIDES